MKMVGDSHGFAPPSAEARLLFEEFGWTPDRRVSPDRYVDLLKMAGYEVFDQAVESLTSLDGIEVVGKPDSRLPKHFDSVAFGSAAAIHYDLFRWSSLKNTFASFLARRLGVVGVSRAEEIPSDSNFVRSLSNRKNCLIAVGLGYGWRRPVVTVLYYLLEDGSMATLSDEWMTLTVHTNPLDAVFDRLRGMKAEDCIDLEDEIPKSLADFGLTGPLEIASIAWW